MEIPIGDAQARFMEAIEAVERGEQVFLTRNGRAVLELVTREGSPVRSRGDLFERAARLRKEFGWDEGSLELPPDFDDPAFSRRVLGLED